MSYKEIAQKNQGRGYYVTYNTVWRYLDREPDNSKTPIRQKIAEAKLAARLRSEGQKWKDIAQAIGVKEATLRSRIELMPNCTYPKMWTRAARQ